MGIKQFDHELSQRRFDPSPIVVDYDILHTSCRWALIALGEYYHIQDERARRRCRGCSQLIRSGQAIGCQGVRNPPLVASSWNNNVQTCNPSSYFVILVRHLLASKAQTIPVCALYSYPPVLGYTLVVYILLMVFFGRLQVFCFGYLLFRSYLGIIYFNK